MKTLPLTLEDSRIWSEFHARRQSEFSVCSQMMDCDTRDAEIFGEASVIGKFEFYGFTALETLEAMEFGEVPC